MGPLVVVEPEAGAQFSPGFTGVGVSFRYTSSYFTVRHNRSTKMLSRWRLPIHADLHPVFLQRLDELPAGELATLVRVKHLGPALSQCLLQASTQKSASKVLDNRQATTYRLCQSMMATR